MKKKILAVLAAVLAGAMVLGGCGSRSSEQKNGSTNSALQEEDRTIKTRELLDLIDYDPSDYVELPEDYMDMKVTLYRDDYKVTDSDVKDYIKQSVLTQYPSYHIKSSKKIVEKKDTVNIDYTGKINGKTFDGGSAEDQFLEIGSNTFIDGFEDGLIGKKAGQKVTLHLKFPKDYSDSSLAGKKVTFTVKINYIAKEKKVTYKTMNDAYVKENFTSISCSTVKELKNYVRQTLESNATQQESQDTQTKILTMLVDDSKVTVPDKLLKERVEQMVKVSENSAKDSGMSLKKYLKQQYSMTEKQYRKQLKKSLPDSIKQELVLQAVIKDQKVTVDGSDYNTWVENMMSSYYMSSLKDFYNQYKVQGGRDYVLMQYAESQALEKVTNSAQVTYKLGSSSSDSSDSSSSSNS